MKAPYLPKIKDKGNLFEKKELFEGFKRKYSLEGNGIYNLIYIDNKIYEVKFIEAKAMVVDDGKLALRDNTKNEIVKVEDEKDKAEIALFETQYTTYGDKMVAWVTLWNNIVWEQVKAKGLNNEDFGLFCGEQSQEMADQLADPTNIAFKGFFCQHDAPTVYDADTLVTRELVKAMKGEEFQRPCMDNPGPYVTKENVYDVWPDTKKY